MIIKTLSGELTALKVFSLAYDTLLFRGYSALWYLPAIFWGELILYFVLRAEKQKSSQLLIAVSFAGVAIMIVFHYVKIYIDSVLSEGSWACELIVTPFLTLSHVISVLTFLTIGVLMYRVVLRDTKLGHIPILIGAIVLLITCSFATQINKEINLSVANLGNMPVLYFVTGIFMAVSIIVLIRLLCSFKYSFPVLSWCGRNSLIIMCTHLPLYVVHFVLTAAKHISLGERMNFYVYYFLLLLVVMVIEILIVFTTNKYFPWMVGKRK